METSTAAGTDVTRWVLLSDWSTGTLTLVVVLCLAVVALALHGVTLPWANTPTPAKGALDLGKLGVGTWSWGNKLLWGYDPAQDAELARAFARAVDGGVRRPTHGVERVAGRGGGGSGGGGIQARLRGRRHRRCSRWGLPQSP